MPTSKRLVDILDENTSEDEDYATKVLPKLEKLYQLIIDSLPMKEEDASFVLDLMEDYVKQGQKISAIKLYRKNHDCTLREAKEYADSIQKDLKIRGLIT